MIGLPREGIPKLRLYGKYLLLLLLLFCEMQSQYTVIGLPRKGIPKLRLFGRKMIFF